MKTTRGHAQHSTLTTHETARATNANDEQISTPPRVEQRARHMWNNAHDSARHGYIANNTSTRTRRMIDTRNNVRDNARYSLTDNVINAAQTFLNQYLFSIHLFNISCVSRVVRVLLACTVRVRCHRPFRVCRVLCSTRTACSIRTTFAHVVHVSSSARVVIRAL